VTIEIPLTQGLVALIDDVDAVAVLAVGKWTANLTPTNAYAYRRPRLNGRSTTISLHAFLTGWPYVDHRNGDGLDNRRANLRAATHAQNVRNRGSQRNNTSGYKGVSFDRSRGLYLAKIAVDRRQIALGRYANPTDAARAYDAAARELHGDFARVNFPEVTA
jgi:hypothetical protein